MRRLCLDGLGLGRVGGFHVEEDIEAGRLVSVLDDYNPRDAEVIWCVYGGSGPLSGRVRAYLDFLSEHVVRPSP
jgi:DNA-binding transcriptional LysR family regulator